MSDGKPSALSMGGLTKQNGVPALRALIDDGTIPAGVDQPGIYFGVRSGEMLTAEGSDWLERYDALRAHATTGAAG